MADAEHWTVCTVPTVFSHLQPTIMEFIFVFFHLQAKVFGMSLESLPYYNMEHGSVPRQVGANQFKVHAISQSCILKFVFLI